MLMWSEIGGCDGLGIVAKNEKRWNTNGWSEVNIN